VVAADAIAIVVAMIGKVMAMGIKVVMMMMMMIMMRRWWRWMMVRMTK